MLITCLICIILWVFISINRAIFSSMAMSISISIQPNKKMKVSAAAFALVFSLVLSGLTNQGHGALQEGFYQGKCSVDVEKIVSGIITPLVGQKPSTTPALLRMQFHDCFVNGCDASILLDGSSSEKTAAPNLSVRGYDVIDTVKAAVEAKCPGLVSCADIIVMATRDAVAASKGGWYSVQTGRRDGLVSLASNVNLPGPKIPVDNAAAMFNQKGISTEDMVYLLGGHTVGVAHCSLFKDRLYNFNNTGRPDPTMDPSLAFFLRLKCPKTPTFDNTVNLDQGGSTIGLLGQPTSNIVDNSFYKQIVSHRGVLQMDQALALHQLTKDTVTKVAFSPNDYFLGQFHQAMVKLGAVQVLTDAQGEIRKSCRAIKVNHG